ncbi:MAG: bifunctional adenosylcobinamide kinase/adenosylcobinamide-phosphate guanylyltransferase [Candidatus Pelagadaptatus aseana]|uniref:bifunctional adenosylcobinamide kinase/adenosylcobinamide-phosphate guanylyltransferase n=1 Tax=Candidatus Pelagadaptatus aseana TaxID=3120508 RepID=UPI0039B1907C
MKELILGGARSGKSSLAEQRAKASGLSLIYLATGQAGDREMAERIVHHQQRRGPEWQLVEEPRLLAERLQQYARADTCILVDCLTLWLSNCLFADEQGSEWDRQKQALLEVLPNLPGQIILVGNETGMGVVPMGEISRRFVDENGWLHQALASQCQRVTLTVAGLPHILKDGDAE